mgnify:FL=1|tara:strand:+ start:159 stop:707 length:549 start_codon:yes stop_codon:yes gene_type:complete
MLNFEYPKFEKKSISDFDLSIIEPKTKINLRGNKKDFFTKAGKILSLILPTEANTNSSNEKFNALWLSPNEWLLYFDEDNKNSVFIDLYNEISKLNYGAITDVSNQWVCFNLKGKKIYDLLSAGSPYDFNEFKNNKNKVAQTLLNNIDVTINQKQINEIDLFVRRSFTEHLCLWMNDSARFI